jgi:glyoxylase-like metal-dependent hydrolase (beta-lactamase superfamily II)
MYLRTFDRGPDRNLTYLFGALGSGASLAAVDPGRDVKPLLKDARGRAIRFIFATHGHADHIEGLAALKEETGALICGHRLIAQDLDRIGVALDVPLTGGQVLDLDGVPIRVMYTPGHHPASIALLVAEHFLFTGDTLFVGNCGRADLPGSDPRNLFVTLGMLSNLPDDVTIYPGHDYGRTPTSTIGREKAENPAMKAKTFEEFEAVP